MLRPTIRVIVGGQDVTNRFQPLLIDVKVTKKEKASSHTATITVADPGGTVFKPEDGAEMQIYLGQSLADAGVVFEGTVNDFTSKGAKGSGRALTIVATSADQKGKVKQQQTKHKDQATFKDVAAEWGKEAGLDVQVLGELASVRRPYWLIMRESFQSWGQRIAQDIGASFQIVGKRAFFSPMNDGKSASGKSLTPITAAVGTNLINWSISPTLARPQYGKITTTFYDRKSGEWKTRTENVENATSQATLNLLESSPSEDRGQRTAKGKAQKSEREKGSGSVTILGDHAAEPGAECIVVGASPGVDNTYIVESVEHSFSGDGFETTLNIKLPSAKGGKDTRTASNLTSTASDQAAAIQADPLATP